MRIFSHIIRRAVPVLALAAISCAVMLFAQGAYTFSFLQKDPATVTPSSPSLSGTETGGAETTNILNDAGESAIVLPQASTMQTATCEADVLYLSEKLAFVPAPAMQLIREGYARSTETYSADTGIFSLAGGFDFLPTERSLYDGYESVLSYVRPTDMSAPEPVYTQRAVAVEAVQLYMGYMLIDDGTTVHVYSPDGFFCLSYKSGTYERAFTRDINGNALFSRKEKNEAGETVTAYYTVGDGAFVPSDYDDEIDGRGLYFDYAPSYGVSSTGMRPLAWRTTEIQDSGTTQETVWAFGYNTENPVTSYKFSRVYNYSEDLAAVLDEDGHMYFLGRWGYRAYNTEGSYYYSNWYVTEYLLPPLTNGLESVGFYYYDHGLVRVRRQIVDWHAYTYWDLLRVASDEDILLDTSGNEFPIPAGYDIQAYSDGVILLERDGKYGYMDYTGAWIAQPIYDYARPFSEGLAVVGFNDGVRLMIDTAGNIVIPAGVYSYISDVSSGVIAAWSKDGVWEILHKMGYFLE